MVTQIGESWSRWNNKGTQKIIVAIYECNECGKHFEAQVANVKRGNTTSCGCGNRKALTNALTTHGLRKHRLYGTWIKMLDRCKNEKHIHYHRYGGRGITVCERWHDIKNFLEDMSPTFKEGLTLDRINNDGNYEPSNCRWATRKEQRSNQS